MTPKPERSYAWVCWTLAVLGFALDQASKYGIFAHLYNEGAGGRIEIIPGAFDLIAEYPPTPVREEGRGLFARLRTISGEFLPRVNQGALFGLGNDSGHNANQIFALVSIAAALAILFWSTRPATARDRLLCMSLGLILAGTLGNLFDRVVFHGVRDFLHWHYPDSVAILRDFPVFNIADCCLVCGAGLLLLQAFLAESRRVPTPAPVVSEAEVAQVK
jgi:signal peptidase II